MICGGRPESRAENEARSARSQVGGTILNQINLICSYWSANYEFSYL
jgi:hypothetical protein